MSRKFRRLYIENARSRSGSVELEELFERYGRIKCFEVRKEQGFVEFEK